MADVADLAGVSVMTVSNAINRPQVVSEATREKVQTAMRELRYRNNLVARSLRLAQPRQIGYALPGHDPAGNQLHGHVPPRPRRRLPGRRPQPHPHHRAGHRSRS